MNLYIYTLCGLERVDDVLEYRIIFGMRYAEVLLSGEIRSRIVPISHLVLVIS